MTKQKKVNDNKHEAINVSAMLHSMDYGRWDHPTVMKAFKVMQMLTKWLESQYDKPENAPVVSIVVAPIAVALLIGETCVWENQNCHEEDLNFDYCRSQLQEEALKMMVPFE
jgi:hypothetical protein